MTSPRKFARYAREWLELFTKMADEPERIFEVPCESEKKAKAARQEFYKARSAFLSDGIDACVIADNEWEFEQAKKRWKNVLDSREVLVRDNSVYFGLKSDNWIGKLISQAHPVDRVPEK